MRRVISVAVAAAVLALLVAPPTQAQTPQYPVILIPGLGGGVEEIAPVRDKLLAEGNQVLYFSEFDGVESNYRTALRTAAKTKEVAATTGKVNLACWSASVMSCRYAMKYLGIQDLVAQVVFYAGGNGNWGMCQLPVYLGGDGCPTHWFARSLEYGDDTPGAAGYFFITSFPETVTPIPDGGICYKYAPFDGFKHTEEPWQPVYQDFIAAGVKGVCLGDFVNKPITNRP